MTLGVGGMSMHAHAHVCYVGAALVTNCILC